MSLRAIFGRIYLVHYGPSDHHSNVVDDLRAVPGAEPPRLIDSAADEEDVYVVVWQPTSRWRPLKQRRDAQERLVNIARVHRGAIWSCRPRRLWEWDGTI